MNVVRIVASTGLLFSMLGAGVSLLFFYRAYNTTNSLMLALQSNGGILLIIFSVFAFCLGFLLRNRKPANPSSNESSKPAGSTAPSVAGNILSAGQTIVYNKGNEIETLILPSDAFVLPTSFSSTGKLAEGAAQPAQNKPVKKGLFERC
jgi:hypothetical protein